MLHAIAFAPGDALGGNFIEAPAESAGWRSGRARIRFKALAEACCR